MSPPRRSQQISARAREQIDRSLLTREARKERKAIIKARPKYACKLCEIPYFASSIALDEHQAGRKHKVKYEAKYSDVPECKECDSIFSTHDQLGQHKRGQKHHKRLRRIDAEFANKRIAARKKEEKEIRRKKNAEGRAKRIAFYTSANALESLVLPNSESD